MIATTQIDGDAAVGRNVAIGGDATVGGNAHIGRNLRVSGWLEAHNIRGAAKGVFTSAAKLREAYPRPHDGWWAGVGTTAPFAMYVGDGGEWVATGGTFNIDADMSSLTELTTTIETAKSEAVAAVTTTCAEALGAIDEAMGQMRCVEVVKTHNIHNTSSTLNASGQWILAGAGRHTYRLTVPWTGDFRISFGPTASNSAGGQAFDTMHVTQGQVLTVTVTVPEAYPWLGFRSWKSETFDYQVEEIVESTLQDMGNGVSVLRGRVDEIEAAGMQLTMPWLGKTLLTWGDSVTAINNGDHVLPSQTYTWGNDVATAHRFAMHYGRGVGSQMWRWGTGGGAVTFVDGGGRYVNRNNGYTLDSYTGALPSGATAMTRGCGCSWDRMCKMLPEAMRQSVDCVLMMHSNDAGGLDTETPDGELQWIEGSTTDPEWAASEEYAAYCGDYNIGTTRGGIASAVMKMQALLPNAVIVLCTPLSGRGPVTGLRPMLRDRGKESLAQIVRDMGRILSVPVVDIYATCGINGLNRSRYITDGVHPYCADGQRMVARAVIGALKGIMPK